MATENIDVVGSGGGFGMGGLGTFGLFGLLGIDSLGGRNALTSDALATRTLEQTIALMQGQTASTASITSEINSLGTNVENRLDNIQSGVNSVGVNLAQLIMGVGTQISEAKYDNALQMCAQTNTIVNAITTGNQRILDAMSCQTIKDLERQLAVAENGGPIVRAGAFVPVNPCHTDSQISNINQVLVQVGNGLVGLQSAVAALAK